MLSSRPLPWALALLVAGCAAEPPLEFPPAHPFLADSAWPIAHGSAHTQGSSPLPGLTGDDARVDLVEVGLPSITLAFEEDGAMLWGSNPLQVFRMRLDPPEVVASVPAGGGLDDLFSGAYTLLDRDGRFYATSRAEVRVYAPDGPEGIAEVGAFALPEPATEETLRGLGLTWDGVLVAASSAGRLVAVDRQALTVVDSLQLDGEISNNVSIDEDGGVYVVTSEAMHRVQWTGEGWSQDPADGAWSATYETGPEDPAGGRLGTGSGSTPSLMTVGEDKLVVITDADPLMHLVLFWRDAIPEGWQAPEGTDPRTAARVPVTFGDPDATTSLSEQSVLVMGHRAVVVNNDYGEGEGMGPVVQGVAPPGVEQFAWDPVADELATSWVIDDLSCPNGIPSASGETGLMYCVGRRGEVWTVEAIDWATGEPAFHVRTGADNVYNSTYAATEIGPDGAIWSGTFGGVLRVGPN